MDRTSFEYGGYHFYPFRSFTEEDGDFYERAHKVREDRDLGLIELDEPWRKYPYNYEEFYKAAGGKQFDIFICAENRRKYVPCSYALQEYMDSPIKNKSTRAGR